MKGLELRVNIGVSENSLIVGAVCVIFNMCKRGIIDRSMMECSVVLYRRKKKSAQYYYAYVLASG